MVKVTAGNVILIGLATGGANILGRLIIDQLPTGTLSDNQQIALNVAANAILATLLLSVLLKNR